MTRLMGAFTKVIKTIKTESDGKYQGIHMPYSDFYGKVLFSTEFAVKALGLKEALTKDQVYELLSKMEAAKLIALPKCKGGRLIVLAKDRREKTVKTNTDAVDLMTKYGI